MMISSGSCSSVAMNWIFCCMPLESSCVFFSMDSAISIRSHHWRARLFAVAASSPCSCPRKIELVDHLHPLVESALFRQIADAAQMVAAEWFIEEPHRTGIRQRHSDHHADGRGLARAVRPQQPEHGARLDAQAQRPHRYFAAIRL